ncbi:glycosyltransferase family 9 protein [Azonexus hydrophilus]|uniref:glycosyltransferase family 9 protein n=1 Tax=Azonexus hydrophilus TaxID=418702 RepID=UPI002493340A|nr:glycosyltransferase family 9 protein [Azonexus hydrophilus]
MKILVIRRDNIGDLVCTTPLIRALRRQLPNASLQALVTHYNAEVLAGNPDLDRVYSYQKAKHRGPGEGTLGIYWQRLKTILALRRERFDWVLLPGGAAASSLRFARMIAAKRVLIRDDQDRQGGAHEVEQCCHLLPRMGLRYETPAPLVVPDPALQQAFREQCSARLGFAPTRLIGVHVSARKPSQRWPADRFAAFIRAVTEPEGTACLLFWAPGTSDDPKHPGDDHKAAEIIAATHGAPVVPLPTGHLRQLIAGLSLCDGVLCADGGAMHLAAALGKPMVCLFGDSDPERWGPWGNPHRIAQAESREVEDLTVESILQRWEEVQGANSAIECQERQ